MNWHDVLDAQIDLYRWWKTPTGQRYGEGFSETFATKNYREAIPSSDSLANIQRDILFVAEPIYVSGEMMDVFEAAQSSFLPEKLIPEDLFTPAGFMYLDRPYTVIDAKGKRVSTRAISWAPMLSDDGKHMGVFLSFYTHSNDDDDYNVQFSKDDNRVWGPSQLSLNHFTHWWFYSQPPRSVEETHINEFYQDDKPENLWLAQIGGLREFQVFMRLASQQLASTQKLNPPRAYGKRAQREGFKPYITVITLRRAKRPTENGEPSTVEWSHRWIVDGHWHKYWYPTLNEHRYLWVGAYVKGPEDKELIVRKKRAFNFVR